MIYYLVKLAMHATLNLGLEWSIWVNLIFFSILKKNTWNVGPRIAPATGCSLIPAINRSTSST